MLWALVLVSACFASSAYAGQLIVTEIMYDPASSEPAWEWIEVYNPSAADVDLSGYFIDRIGDPARGVNPTPNIQPVVSVDGQAVLNPTRVTAGRTAVLYNGDTLGFDADRFRTAWPQTPAAVPLIGVSGWGGNALANNPIPPDVGPVSPGLTFGFWPNETAYRSDTANLGTFTDPDERVVGLTGASFSFAYAAGGDWPESNNAASIAYAGIGSTLSGGSWNPSALGLGGATSSEPTFLAGEPINGPDHGSPALPSPGVAPPPNPTGPSLLITEIMYNPASSTGSREWEWIEVFNHGTTPIDFAATPMWLDDDDGSAINAANLAAGTIPAGGAAVLFDSAAATLAQMQAAWDGSDPTRFIPAALWPALANTGDSIGVWDSAVLYSIDKINGADANAIATVRYDDVSPWPSDNGADSIYLRSLAFDPNLGPAWARSTGGSNPDPAGYRAAEVLDPLGTVDNSGADIGSPGLYPDAIPPLAGDYNNDGAVNAADYTVWRDGLPLSNETASPGLGDEADYLAWGIAYLAQTTALGVPEPGSAALAIVAGGMVGCLPWGLQGRVDLR